MAQCRLNEVVAEVASREFCMLMHKWFNVDGDAPDSRCLWDFSYTLKRNRIVTHNQNKLYDKNKHESLTSSLQGFTLKETHFPKITSNKMIEIGGSHIVQRTWPWRFKGMWHKPIIHDDRRQTFAKFAQRTWLTRAARSKMTWSANRKLFIITGQIIHQRPVVQMAISLI